MGTVNKLEVCVSNLELGSGFVWTQAQATYPALKLRRWGCLGYCHRCLRFPFVLLNDTEYVEGSDADDLWRQTQDKLSF